MKKKLNNAKLGLIILMTLVMVAGAFAQSPQPKTVTEFYLALPGGIYGIEGTQDSETPGFESDFFFYSNERNESKAAIRQYRKSLIEIEDVNNGYLKLGSNEWEGWVEMALFKKADGTYLFAISQVGCGPSCDGGVLFATYNDGRWKNVTKQVFPVTRFAGESYFKLPRVGTTIEQICGDESGETCEVGKKLAEFTWNKRKFVN